MSQIYFNQHLIHANTRPKLAEIDVHRLLDKGFSVEEINQRSKKVMAHVNNQNRPKK